LKTPTEILTVVGTRPEAIKLAPVILKLKSHGEKFNCRVCYTGQHREMVAQVMQIFDIQPDFDLNIMLPGQTLAQITARAVEGLDGLIASINPDLVLVQGDTTSAFCGALTAYYHKVKVGHVEAGLRTNNKYAPYPEEINRRLLGTLTDFHFAPTANARQALLREGVAEENIFVTGNTVIDALLFVRDKIKQTPPELPAGLCQLLGDKRLVVVTGHRRENFGEGMEHMCTAIRKTADAFDDVIFVYPVHLNPNVREPVGRILSNHPRIILIEPLSYEPFVWLLDRATIVLTDSGGVQEEAPSLGKPVLVMRDVTERPEGVQAGNARLVGTNQDRIIHALTELLEDPSARQAMSAPLNPYGDGHAAERIAGILEKAFMQTN